MRYCKTHKDGRIADDGGCVLSFENAWFERCEVISVVEDTGNLWRFKNPDYERTAIRAGAVVRVGQEPK